VKYSVFNTAFGYVSVFEEAGKLKKLFLPVERYDEAVNRVKDEFPEAVEEQTPGLVMASELTKGYFEGVETDFSAVKTDLGAISGFTKNVLEAARKIKYGQTVSYKVLAEMAGNISASRAAGAALHKNPLPVIIPCHRVIKNSGELGGYSAGPGWKIKLLKLEKIL
jgi:methylated-DNA-[protein]-cysteine S-methyltransferase